MSLSYACQKLKETVSYLGSTEGDLRVRLKWTYGNCLAGPGLPGSWGIGADEASAEFTSIMEVFRSIGADAAPIDRMSSDDLKQLAKRIVDLYSEVAMRDPYFRFHDRPT